MTDPGKSLVLMEIDAIDCLALSTSDAYCTIQWLCHMLSPLHDLLQQPSS